MIAPTPRFRGGTAAGIGAGERWSRGLGGGGGGVGRLLSWVGLLGRVPTLIRLRGRDGPFGPVFDHRGWNTERSVRELPRRPWRYRASSRSSCTFKLLRAFWRGHASTSSNAVGRGETVGGGGARRFIVILCFCQFRKDRFMTGQCRSHPGKFNPHQAS